MLLLDGKKCAAGMAAKLADEIAAARATGLRPPGLAVILAGDDAASATYVRNKERACARVGVASFPFFLPASCREDELLGIIGELNLRQDVDGILVQLPLPAQINAAGCLLAIDPDKDVDGFHPVNMGRLVLGLPGFVPCTPAGVMRLLEEYQLSPAGRRAVVVGRSNIVGKPLSIILASPRWNATVTQCHSATRDLKKECLEADFLFLAMGRPNYVGADMVAPGAVVVDVGISQTPHGLCGDADFRALADRVSAITPVPGGVGPMTIAMLLENTASSWRMRTGWRYTP